jgi:tetrahydromethanopterin S-methyltransferase subunit B
LNFEDLGLDIIYPYTGFGKTDQEIEEFMDNNDITYDEDTDILTIERTDHLVLSSKEVDKKAQELAEEYVDDNLEMFAEQSPRYLEMTPTDKRVFIADELDSLSEDSIGYEYETYEEWYEAEGSDIEARIEEDPIAYLEDMFTYGDMVDLHVVDYNVKDMADDLILEATAVNFLEDNLGLDFIDEYDIGAGDYYYLFEVL